MVYRGLYMVYWELCMLYWTLYVGQNRASVIVAEGPWVVSNALHLACARPHPEMLGDEGLGFRVQGFVWIRSALSICTLYNPNIFPIRI